MKFSQLPDRDLIEVLQAELKAALEAVAGAGALRITARVRALDESGEPASEWLVVVQEPRDAPCVGSVR
jgi:hypothetical protein